MDDEHKNLTLAKKGDTAAQEELITKYKPMVWAAAAKWNIPGAEREDLIQEGLIGLYGAINAFDQGRGVDFYPFAKLCVERRLQTALKTALRGKHNPLRSYEPISPDLISQSQTPEEALLDKESIAALEMAINAHLSSFERKTLAMRLTGLGNTEIANSLNCTPKAVYNAIARARRKLGK